MPWVNGAWTDDNTWPQKHNSKNAEWPQYNEWGNINDNNAAESSSSALRPHAPVFTPRNLPQIESATVNELSTTNFDFRKFWLSLPRRRQEDQWDITTDTALDWTGYIDKEDSLYPIGTGTYGEVYKAKWQSIRQYPDSLPPVVIKFVRMGGKEKQMKQLKQVKREMKIWSGLRHENILQFVGFIIDQHGFPALVSLYMDNGTVKEYLAKHPNISKTKLLLGIAKGLDYLHNYDPKIIHGDLKADNVLVDRSGTPCLCDFGVSWMLVNQTLWKTTAENAPGTLRWMAPELLDGTETIVTRKADIYAYGMTALEIVSGEKPFHNIPASMGDVAVLTAVALHKKKPEIPSYVQVSPALQQLWHDCWSWSADDRPSAGQVVLRMRQIRASAMETLTNPDYHELTSQMEGMRLRVPASDDGSESENGSRTPRSRLVDVNICLDRRHGGIKWNLVFPLQTVTALHPPTPDEPAFEPNLSKCQIRVKKPLPLESLAWTIDVKAAPPYDYITVLHLLHCVRASMKRPIDETKYLALESGLRKRINAAYDRRWKGYQSAEAELKRLEGIKRVDMLLDQTGWLRLKSVKGSVDTFDLILSSAEELNRPAQPEDFRVKRSTQFITGGLEPVENDVPPTVLQMQAGFVPNVTVIPPPRDDKSTRKRRKSYIA